MPSPYERVVIDSSVLIGAVSREIVAGAALGYCHAFWSPWIVGEYVRNRIEWVVVRPGWDQAGGAERKRRLEAVRRKINSAGPRKLQHRAARAAGTVRPQLLKHPLERTNRDHVHW